MSVCWHVCKCTRFMQCPKKPEEGVRSFGTRNCLLWVLGPNCGPSARAASVVNLWAMSPAPIKSKYHLPSSCFHEGHLSNTRCLFFIVFNAGFGDSFHFPFLLFQANHDTRFLHYDFPIDLLLYHILFPDFRGFPWFGSIVNSVNNPITGKTLCCILLLYKLLRWKSLCNLVCLGPYSWGWLFGRQPGQGASLF